MRLSLSYKISRIAVLVLFVCLLNAGAGVSAQTINGLPKASAALHSDPASGILNIAEGAEVYVNGNRVQDGMTVLSGAEVETRAKGAIIALKDLGVVLLCRESKMNLLFADGRVEIKLTSGDARLEMNPGANGEIVTPGGANLTSDAGGVALTPEYEDVRCGCRDTAAAPVPTAALPGLFPLLGVAGGAVGAIIIGTQTGDDESPVSISRVLP